MKPIRLLLLAALLLGTGTAMAGGYYRGHGHGHGHVHGSVGFYFGAPFYPMFPPPPTYYYAPRVFVVPGPQAPVYIEQAPAVGDGAYWHYCPAANAYYPQVGDCPGGWIRVPPR